MADLRAAVSGYGLGSESLLPEFDALVEAAGGRPLPIVINCPTCGERHIDEGVWATKSHRTHRCAACGLEWRPANIATVGVQFLPQPDLEGAWP